MGIHIVSKSCFQCALRPPIYMCLDCGEDICINCLTEHSEEHEEEDKEEEKKAKTGL